MPSQKTNVLRPVLKPDSLAFTLSGAARAVGMVSKGTALPQALAQVFAATGASSAARGAIQDIAYRSMRQWGRVQVLLPLLVSKHPEQAVLHGLLSVALTLLVDPDDTSYDHFTVVNQAVEAAASEGEIAHAKGMVNAVLRRFLRERAELLSRVLQQPEAVWNYPAWWIEAARTAYPQTWESLLQAGNAPPPLTLRVNRRKIDIAAMQRMLQEQNMESDQIGPDALRLARAVPVGQIPGFSEGMVSVQDAAAQLAAPLLDVRDGMRVLDACAAPGGKTGHLLECANIELLALDNDPQRLTRVHDNLARLGLYAELKRGDAARDDWWKGQLFDRIIADVPCTASGIVRRHPDIRWLRRKGDAQQLASASAGILDNLWRMLAPGGKMLFVTCSVWPQESEAQAAAFAMRKQAVRLPAPGQLLPGVLHGVLPGVADSPQPSADQTAHADGAPDTGLMPDALLKDHDGLFYALFQKAAV